MHSASIGDARAVRECSGSTVTAVDTSNDLALRPSHDHWFCEPCNQWVIPNKPHWKWRVAECAFWGSMPITIFVLKGFGMIAIPFILFFTGALAGPLREEAGADARCPHCKKFIFAPKKKPALS
jgi:hypothetical protein